MAQEQTEVLLEVTRVLEQLRIPYFICGSIASSAYGFYRATADADLVADVQPHHAALLAAMLQPAFYADEQMIRHAAQTKGSFNLIHNESLLKVDVFTLSPTLFQQSQMSRRQLSGFDPASSLTAYLASPEDTVLAKLDWYRQGDGVSDRQWTDVVGVLKVQGESLDHAYLRQWAVELGLSDLLERALEHAGLPASNSSS
jgi:hypothetical protein